MTSNLYRLVYYSRNHILGGPAEVELQVHKILEQSRRNNSLVGVTGALIFNNGIFAQVLEGTQAGLESTFERIQRDERHGDVQVLTFEAMEGRSFTSWSMAFVGRSREGQQLFGHIGEKTGFEAKRMEGERIFSILQDITTEEEVRVA